jgi:hypothetical protein
MRRILSTAIALSWLGITNLGAETISVARPTIHPDTAENRSAIDSILGRAAVLADRQYGDLFSVEYGGVWRRLHDRIRNRLLRRRTYRIAFDIAHRE